MDEISDKNNDTDDFKIVIFNGNLKKSDKIRITPNEKYLITYNEYTHSIVGWNVESVDKGQLGAEFIINNIPDNIRFESGYAWAFSDNKKAATSCGRLEGVYDMNNGQLNKLDMDFSYTTSVRLTFNLNNDLIAPYRRVIFIHSTQTKNNKWNCKRIYKALEYCKNLCFISISSKYNKVYFRLNNFIYEFDLITEKSIKIYVDDGEKMRHHGVEIASNENFVCLRFGDKIIIYSVEFENHIISLDIKENVNQLRKLMKHPTLCSLLFPLLLTVYWYDYYDYFWNSVIKDFWNKCINHLKQNDQLPKEQKYHLINIRATNKYVFVIMDVGIWKIDLEKMISAINSLLIDEIVEDVDMYDNLHILLPNSYMKTIRELFHEVVSDYNPFMEKSFIQDSVTWNIMRHSSTNNLFVRVYKNTRLEKICDSKLDHDNSRLLGIKFLNEGDVIILTQIGLFIYHFDKVKKSISLNYYYYMKLSEVAELKKYENDFLNYTDLPLPNYTSFKICEGWVKAVKDNKERLLKYGAELLKFAIEEHDLKLIDEIYKKCIGYFKEDYNNNFLSIITSTMPLLNEYYPEHIERYSLETMMIIDSPSYNMEYQNKEKYSNLYFKVVGISLKLKKTKSTPTLVFLNPYIKFINYPKNYDWFMELIKPQPSPFVETMNSDIYKTWNGESIINFKWNMYGKYYYAGIWILFMAYLGCFTTAVTISQQYIEKDVQKRLLIASIILGFIHLSFEIRQIIYDFNKWIEDFWNIFDVIAYVLPILTSILWLQSSEINMIPLFSFSCLFLDIKFLLFFRAFESFGIYFAIIISVAKQIISFLLVLFIIIISFAHAFYILLLPRSQYSLEEHTNNDDPNNPWNIASTYNQVFENGSINPNPYIIQLPSDSTNMFIDFRTAIFATYKFLTGDSSAFSNWSYTTNPSLAILVVLFSLLIVVYLMNLLIGLLNIAIEKDNNRVSYLVQKAEILAEIELFYLLPHQRRWYKWFPKEIYYLANADKTREKIKELIKNNEWNNEFSEMKKNLLKELNIENEEATLQSLFKEMKEMKGEMKGMKEEMKGTKEEMKETKEEMKGMKEEMKGTKEEMKETKEE
ncbi:hypothetical protein GLOIN_2v1537213 [Rhizophagus clarus]|uniref:Ion transport domain-containing protein n=1 Tax=Rhizophagus clarus TaxID=94130 RepID=A0A8H3LZU3_9GLOM|nr:hypothetical protein GLOIN_2v1537213 [Rhizophagus clarus]